MSTILDALKKSEQERKLNKVPTLSDMVAPPEPSKWPLILGIVLCVVALITLLVTVFWWGKGSSSMSSPRVVNKSASVLMSDPPVSSNVDGSDVLAEEVIVNVVSFSEDLNQRFAMVNGKMVREGGFVRAGLQVDKIQMSSVVFNHRGKKITRSP